MKKRIIIIITLIIIVILVVIVASKRLSLAPELKTIDGITMRINDLTNTSATIIIENKTDSNYTTGRNYRIDKNINGKWYKMNMQEDMVTTMDALVIKSGNSLEMYLDWDRYYKMESGKYRIVKDITNDDNFKKYNIGVEFDID